MRVQVPAEFLDPIEAHAGQMKGKQVLVRAERRHMQQKKPRRRASSLPQASSHWRPYTYVKAEIVGN